MGKRSLSEVAEEPAWPQIDRQPLQFLMGGQDLGSFQEQTWERAPKLYKAEGARQQLFSSWGSKDAIQAAMAEAAKASPSESDTLEAGTDVVAARCADGVRETIRPEASTNTAFWHLYDKEGCTLQVMQPQRWIDGLWRLTAALEAQLGCLVGVNAYLTPAGTQGLAPHHDDVELWICQTQGSKRWRLYKPHMQLPALPSPDLSAEEIGEPVMEVTLQEGDVLYMPRGTIHQAQAQQEDSVHLTISTYQRWTHAELLQRWLGAAAAASSEEEALPLSLRRGLPLNLVTSPNLPATAGALAQALEELAAQLRQRPEVLQTAVSDLTEDFISHRIPPHPAQLPDRGLPPGLEDRVVASWPGAACMLDCSDVDPDDLPEELAGETDFIKVISCLENSRSSHMIARPEACGDTGCTDAACGGEQHAGHEGHACGAASAAKHAHADAASGDESGSEDEDDDATDLVLPGDHRAALTQLLSGSPHKVCELSLPRKQEKLGLAAMLWSEGLLCNLGPAPATPVKAAAGAKSAQEQKGKRARAGS